MLPVEPNRPVVGAAAVWLSPPKILGLAVVLPKTLVADG